MRHVGGLRLAQTEQDGRVGGEGPKHARGEAERVEGVMAAMPAVVMAAAAMAAAVTEAAVVEVGKLEQKMAMKHARQWW